MTRLLPSSLLTLTFACAGLGVTPALADHGDSAIRAQISESLRMVREDLYHLQDMLKFSHGRFEHTRDDISDALEEIEEAFEEIREEEDLDDLDSELEDVNEELTHLQEQFYEDRKANSISHIRKDWMHLIVSLEKYRLAILQIEDVDIDI